MQFTNYYQLGCRFLVMNYQQFDLQNAFVDSSQEQHTIVVVVHTSFAAETAAEVYHDCGFDYVKKHLEQNFGSVKKDHDCHIGSVMMNLDYCDEFDYKHVVCQIYHCFVYRVVVNSLEIVHRSVY